MKYRNQRQRRTVVELTRMLLNYCEERGFEYLTDETLNLVVNTHKKICDGTAIPGNDDDYISFDSGNDDALASELDRSR